MTDVDRDPISDAEELLARALAGAQPGISAASAQDALEQAREDKEDGRGGRSLGLALIHARDLYDGGDFQEFLIALTDGTRDAAIVARLAGSAVAALQAQDESVADHLLERIRRAVGTLPNDGHRYENVILNHPAMYTGTP